EIESQLSQCPGIKEAVVILEKNNNTDYSKLIGYITGNNEINNLELRNYLLNKIPSYMIPNQFIQVDFIPLTPNGKIDRKELLLMKNKLIDSSNHVKPISYVEKLILEIWQNILEIRNIDINDNFFDLGGHSLLAVEMISKVKKVFNIHIPVSIVFEYPTILELANKIEGNNQINKLLLPFSMNLLDKPPVFLIHGSGGDILNFLEISKVLDEKFSVYGIRSPEMAGYNINYNLDDLAALYANEIIKSSSGPYTIMGWSMGGLIALKVTKILEDKGLKVRVVGLIDTYISKESNSNKYLKDILYLLINMLYNERYYSEDIFIELNKIINDFNYFEINDNELSDKLLYKINLLLVNLDIKDYILLQIKTILKHINISGDFEFFDINSPLHVFEANKNLSNSDLVGNLYSELGKENITFTSLDANHFSILDKENVIYIKDKIENYIY
ncbi:hypothetical protein JZM37_19030, partial [Acinetobacter pittii]